MTEAHWFCVLIILFYLAALLVFSLEIWVETMSLSEREKILDEFNQGN